MFKKIILAVTASTGLLATAPATHADSNPYLGDVIVTAFNFCPRGFARADGQIIAINSNQALYALLGTQFGGNGTTNFALPNLNGRVLVHYGQGQGLQNNYNFGQTAGSETTTVTTPSLPLHSHNVQASAANGNSGSFNNANFAQFPGFNGYVSNGTADGDDFAPSSITTTGNSTPMNNMQPYTVMNYCVATQGLFPPRD